MLYVHAQFDHATTDRNGYVFSLTSAHQCASLSDRFHPTASYSARYRFQYDGRLRRSKETGMVSHNCLDYWITPFNSCHVDGNLRPPYQKGQICLGRKWCLSSMSWVNCILKCDLCEHRFMDTWVGPLCPNFLSWYTSASLAIRPWYPL